MLTKHRFWFAKSVEGQWKRVITVDFSCNNTRELKTERRNFFGEMQQQYGPEGSRWSVRWTDYGADVRFRTDADAASFHMFFTR